MKSLGNLIKSTTEQGEGVDIPGGNLPLWEEQLVERRKWPHGPEPKIL